MTSVYSSNSGVWPGSSQPPGLCICAMLSASVAELTRPTYSRLIFGLLPAASTTLGDAMSVGIAPGYIGSARSLRRRRYPKEAEYVRIHHGAEGLDLAVAD